MEVSGQDFNLFLIDCSQISCGKSLKVKNCNNCVCVQVHRSVNTHKKNKQISNCVRQCAKLCVCTRVCVCMRVLACAAHFKEFLDDSEKVKGPSC